MGILQNSGALVSSFSLAFSVFIISYFKWFVKSFFKLFWISFFSQSVSFKSGSALKSAIHQGFFSFRLLSRATALLSYHLFLLLSTPFFNLFSFITNCILFCLFSFVLTLLLYFLYCYLRICFQLLHDFCLFLHFPAICFLFHYN